MNVNIFITENGWAYKGIKTKIGKLSGLEDRNEKLWTMVGAVLYELHKSGVKEITIYNDSRFVDEWNETVDFISPISLVIARRIKNEFVKNFFSIKVERMDRISIEKEFE